MPAQVRADRRGKKRSTKLKPPPVPRPMIGGGAIGTARPPRTCRSFWPSRAMIAGAPSDSAFLSSKGLSDTIKNAAFGCE